MRLKLICVALLANPAAHPMNYKNLNYEIETCMDSSSGNELLTMNYKNLNYEIETCRYGSTLDLLEFAMNYKNLNYEIETRSRVRYYEL